MKKVIFLTLFLTFLIFPPKKAAGLTPTPGKEIIYPEALPFCNILELKYLPATISATISAEIPRRISGELKMESAKFPLLSKIEETFLNALDKVLSFNQKQNLSLDEKKLSTKAYHYIVDQPPTPQPNNPQSTFDQPGWFSKLLGESRILCAILGNCPPSYLKTEVIQPTLPPSYPLIAQCRSETEVINEDVDNLQNPKTHFSLTTTQDTLKKYTQGPLLGGDTLKENTSFLTNILPAKLNPAGNAFLSVPADYSIYPNFAVLGKEDLNYPLGKTRRDFCLFQCSLYPQKSQVVPNLYPFCPSCDSNDYPLWEGIDDVLLDMSLCQRNPDNSCDYYQPGDHPRCDGDPICESNKCYPLMWRQANDYTSRGCSVPYPAPNCNTSSVCRKVKFSKNPAGGFGACQYSNPDVCVRADRNIIGSCAALCNWACCVYQ